MVAKDANSSKTALNEAAWLRIARLIRGRTQLPTQREAQEPHPR